MEAVNRGEGDAVRFDGRTFKALAGWGAQFDYAAFVKGEDSEAQMLCAMATVALNGAKTYYEEKHDKATFVKNIISDNILAGGHLCPRQGAALCLRGAPGGVPDPPGGDQRSRPH